jgi:hypothetical protein
MNPEIFDDRQVISGSIPITIVPLPGITVHQITDADLEILSKGYGGSFGLIVASILFGYGFTSLLALIGTSDWNALIKLFLLASGAVSLSVGGVLLRFGYINLKKSRDVVDQKRKISKAISDIINYNGSSSGGSGSGGVGPVDSGSGGSGSGGSGSGGSGSGEFGRVNSSEVGSGGLSLKFMRTDFSNPFVSDNTNVRINEDGFIFNGVGMAYTFSLYTLGLSIEYDVNLGHILSEELRHAGDNIVYKRFHDMRLHFFPDGDFRKHITIIFPWELISDHDRENLECRISYQITDENLQKEMHWSEHARNIEAPVVYSGDRYKLRNFKIGALLTLNELAVSIKSEQYKSQTILVPYVKFINAGMNITDKFKIGIQSVNSYSTVTSLNILDRK